MKRALPAEIAIVLLGRSAVALANQLRAALPGARLRGPRARAGDWDVAYDRASAHIAALFAARRPIGGIRASGILIRAVAPLLASTRDEPRIVAVTKDGSAAMPLIGGHSGANAIAGAIADATGAVAAITTARDLRLGVALDEPPPGWRIANPERIKAIAAALLAGAPVALVEEVAHADWLRTGAIAWAEKAPTKIVVTDRAAGDNAAELVFHPPVLALGVGCARDAPAGEIVELAEASLVEAGLAAGAVAAIASLDLKRAEPAIHALGKRLGAPARFFGTEQLLAQTERLTERSAAVFAATGCWGVAEGAALAAAGPGGVLVVPKRKSRHATCAIARAPQPLDASAIGRPCGRLAVIAIAPGDPEWRTPEARAALAVASEVGGYRLYLDLLGPEIAGKRRRESALGGEERRVRRALGLAAEGREMVLVSSRDPGIYGLAALLFELLDHLPRRDWLLLEIAVCPGISAMQAAAARAGARLGHDFCAISLSDPLPPWAAIRRRLEAAAAGAFVIALYNPGSARRDWQLTAAAEILLQHRAMLTPVFVGRNLGRRAEASIIIGLGDLADFGAEHDMVSLVIIGSSATRIIAGDPLRLYTSRGYRRGMPA
jgi:cobalt-precorrin 5A hydrolase/precorrin-3B C17-methyltransferase